jgi:hypothetical protein
LSSLNVGRAADRAEMAAVNEARGAGTTGAGVETAMPGSVGAAAFLLAASAAVESSGALTL